MNIKNPILPALSISFAIGGAIMVASYAGWQVAFGVGMLIWAHNIEKH